MGLVLLIHKVCFYRTHTTTHHNRWNSSGRVISSSQRPLPANTQHSKQTDIHAQGGIRIHDLRRRAALHLRLRRRGNWDRHIGKNSMAYKPIKNITTYFCISHNFHQTSCVLIHTYIYIYIYVRVSTLETNDRYLLKMLSTLSRDLSHQGRHL